MMLYDTDKEGQCMPSYVPTEYNEEINIYYAQRAEELKRLHAEVLEGKISPIGLFFHLQHMSLGDLAKRVGLRPGQVEKQMTPLGFKSATVEQLQKYAKVFDVAVADFFEFFFISDEIVTESAKFHNRLILQTVFSVKKP